MWSGSINLNFFKISYYHWYCTHTPTPPTSPIPGKMVDAGELSPRSAMIATYALCGFSNFGSIGIALGTIGGMAPARKPLLAKIALRAMIAGAISCFLTASLAGVLVDSPIACKSMSATASNGTCVDLAQVLSSLTSGINRGGGGNNGGG